MPTNKETIIWWVIGGIVVGLLAWAMIERGAGTPTPTTAADPSLLPGIRQDEAPWPLEVAHLADRLAADSLPKSTMEGEVLHIHQHLDLVVHGKPVAVPAGVGINERAGWLSPIHVHDATGIIHIESPFKATFTLGEFFDVWGVLFTGQCLGGYCEGESSGAVNTLRVYVNGELYSGDPRALALSEHQEIAIIYGTAAEMPATIPSTYSFPEGY